MARSDDPHAADVFDFVDAYVAARERGEDPALAHWLARFPASQEAVAHEWLNLRRPEEVASADGASPRQVAGADRIGPYRLISELGRGGQGTVFLAEDTRILRRVALKVLASRFDTIRDDKLRRFRREAEIIARLEHPSLCTVYEADLEGDTPYLAMRYIEGRTLAEVIADAKRQDESSEVVHLDAGDETTPRAAEAHFPPRSKLELDQVLLFFERAARALHAAHEAGVVHRDVKPGNVIVTLDGKPVILDFGLARDESESDASRITESGEVFGTPSYMSPEQLELQSDALDRRTDVYSLGVALYESLTLHRPFEQAARPALYVAIQSHTPPDPRTYNAKLPEDVAVVLETALEKDRARRYATALDLAEDLRRIRQYEPIRARPAGVGVRFARWVRKHPTLAAMTIGTIVSLSGGLAIALNLLAAEKRAVNDKDAALLQKDAALSVALGNHLAQRSVELVREDASAALALGIIAAERAPGYQTLSALYPALEGCWLEHELKGDASIQPQLMTDLAVDPRGRYAVGTFPDGVAIVWDLASGTRANRIDVCRGSIDVLDIDAEGRRVALASSDGSITVADLFDGGIVGTIPTGRRATRLEFSLDGTRLLVRAATGAVGVVDLGALAVVAERPGPYLDARWDVDCGTLLFGFAGFECADALLRPAREKSGGTGANLAVDVAPDARWFARALDTGEIEARNQRGEVVARFPSPASPVRSIALSPRTGRIALRAGPDESATAWICTPGGAPMQLAIPGRRPVSRLVWSPDGERIVVVAGDPVVRVYDARTGASVRDFPLRNRQIDAVWSPDGSRLVTATMSNFGHVWYARERPDMVGLDGHTGCVRSLRTAHGGTRLLSASADGTARTWSLDGGDVGRIFEHGTPLLDARFAAGDEVVVTSGEDAVVRAYSVASGARLDATPPIESGIAAIATHDAGSCVAIVANRGSASLWDPGEPNADDPRAVEIAGTRIVCATFLSGGEHVAFGASDGSVAVVDALDLHPGAHLSFRKPAGQDLAIVAIDASPAGELAVGCSDQTVRFWRPGDDRESRPERKGFYLRSILWDPQGERVLVLGLEPGTKAVRVVDAASDKTRLPHNAHRGNITCAAFSADGTQALSGAVDGSVFVWSTRDGSPVVQRTDLGASVRSAVFVRRPDGPSIAAGLEDGRIRVWPLDPLAAARRRLPRALADWELKRERALAAPLPFD